MSTTESAPRWPRSFWLLLVAGLALRCVALTQPLVDAHLLRQTQTAAVTQSLQTEPGFPLTAQIPWIGDVPGRFVLEIPIYNYLVLGLDALVGHLDVSGKLVSVLLWAVSFFFLQALWRRMLQPGEALWANVLFVVAPLGVFYGQAFMPEMLVQALSLGFVAAVARYGEQPTLGRWAVCAAAGLAALLAKLPETSHLYLLLAFVVWQRLGWRCAVWPRHLIAAALTVVALKAWSHYADAANHDSLPEWSSARMLPGFIGTLASRFTLKPWLMIVGYLGAFVITGPAALAALGGLWVFLRERRSVFLGAWLLSLVAYYLIWFGNAGPAQSYYNLPALPPLAALFGLGMHALLAWEKIARWRTAASLAAAALLLVCVAPVLRYLFTPDRTLLAAAAWLRDHTPPGSAVIFRPNHRWDMVEYPPNPVLAYCARRPTFVWVGDTPESLKKIALERALCAVVTLPPPPATGLAGRLQRLRGSGPPQLAPLDWLAEAGFVKTTGGEGFAVYERR